VYSRAKVQNKTKAFYHGSVSEEFFIAVEGAGNQYDKLMLRLLALLDFSEEVTPCPNWEVFVPEQFEQVSSSYSLTLSFRTMPLIVFNFRS